MTIKAAGTPLKWSEIQTEFGPTPTSMSNMKQYRDIDPVGGITDLSLDENYSVDRFPTSGAVKFSDFYSKQLNIIVNYYDALSTDWSLVYNAFSVSPVYRVRLVIATGVYTYTANNANIGTSTDTTLDLGSTRYLVGDEVLDTGDTKIFKIKIEQKGNSRVDAKLKYDSGTINQDFVVVGGMRGKPGSTADCKVRIHVNQEIVSGKGNAEICALKTGSWGSTTTLAIDVGANGRIYGAGGNGGRGGGGIDDNNACRGFDGESGTSALGIQHTGTPSTFTYINIMNGGLIQAGYGGGGGGGAAFDEIWGGGIRNTLKRVTASSGGGGGGGAGVPVGDGGAGGNNNNYGCAHSSNSPKYSGFGQPCTGGVGESATSTTGGDGGEGIASEDYPLDAPSGDGGAAGDGGKGADIGGTAEAGQNGTGGDQRGVGGTAGTAGAAIRKVASVNIIDVATIGPWNNNGIGTKTGDLNASGVQ